jgi:hypothetical protein
MIARRSIERTGGIASVLTALSASRADSGKAVKHSAGMPIVLRWARALPSLRILLLRRGLATVDDQAIAFSLALAAYSPGSQSRATAGLARRRQLLIHLVRSILK